MSWNNKGRPLRVCLRTVNSLDRLTDCPKFVPRRLRKLAKSGSSGWIRTSNPPVNSRMLYR